MPFKMNSYTPTPNPFSPVSGISTPSVARRKVRVPEILQIRQGGRPARRAGNELISASRAVHSKWVSRWVLTSPSPLTLYPRGLRKIITLWRRHTARSPEWDASRRRKRSGQRGSEREGKRGMSVSWGERIGTKIVFSPANGEKLIPSAQLAARSCSIVKRPTIV